MEAQADSSPPSMGFHKTTALADEPVAISLPTHSVWGLMQTLHSHFEASREWVLEEGHVCRSSRIYSGLLHLNGLPCTSA